jgi:DNA-binding NtrC family response regulator
MVTVNIGGLPEGVFESELFGHVKGAYTDAKSDRVGRFELADQGTLFLDEIATITAAQQAKLLRVLETGEFERVGSSRTTRVDVRVISATNSDLSAEVVEGRFRQDLYFRLNTVEISLPPLRRRQEDIPLLADVLLDRYCRKYGKSLQGLTSRAAQSLREYHWPGNIRELDHAIERAVLMTTADRIEAPDLGLRPPARGERSLEDLSLEEVEEALIRKALSRCDSNVSHAAKALGLSRSALYRRIKKLNL